MNQQPDPRALARAGALARKGLSRLQFLYLLLLCAGPIEGRLLEFAAEAGRRERQPNHAPFGFIGHIVITQMLVAEL